MAAPGRTEQGGAPQMEPPAELPQFGESSLHDRLHGAPPYATFSAIRSASFTHNSPEISLGRRVTATRIVAIPERGTIVWRALASAPVRAAAPHPPIADAMGSCL